MKTQLKYLALFAAVSLPAAFAAELAGVSLPVPLDSTNLFVGFVSVFVSLTAFHDYGRATRTDATPAAAPVGKAEHPLAA
jgi:hypothetical protein